MDLHDNQDTSYIKKIIIAVIGIVATAIIGNYALHSTERNFPNVYIGVEVDGHYPCIHMLSDAVNEFTVATLDKKIPVLLSLENDNKAPIRIKNVSLVVDDFEVISRDSFLLCKDFFNQGEEKYVRLDTFKKINTSQNTYLLSIVDENTGKKKEGTFLRLEAGLTDICMMELDFDEEGLYEFHFDVDYVIHGKTHTESTDKARILHIHRTPEAIKNPDNPELKNKLIFSFNYGDSDYSIYGDGTMVINRMGYGDYLYENYNYLLKRIIVEEGTQSINSDYIMIAGPNVNEIYLPSTLNYICDSSFNEHSLYTEHYEDNSNMKTIIYNGSVSDWMNKVRIGDDNDLLYDYEIEFSDGSRGKIGDFRYTGNHAIE